MQKTESNYDNSLSSEQTPNEVVKSNLEHMKIRAKDVDDLVKDIQNACKMTFEQVFLLMRYARVLMSRKESHSLESRMRLINIIFNLDKIYIHPGNINRKNIEDIQNHTLQQLEENFGSNDIIAYLQSLGCDESTNILNEIQSDGIAFAPIGHTKHYTYYSMYMAIYYPIDIFEKLLSQKIYEKADIEKLLFDSIQSHARTTDPKYNIHMMVNSDKIPEERKQKISELMSEFKYSKIVEYFKITDKDSILKELRTKIAFELGEWASDVFAKITNPLYSKIVELSPLKKPFFVEEFFEIQYDLDKTTISLDSNLVNNLYRINQLDDLFDSLKLGLKAKISPNTNQRWWEKERSINNETALADVSSWYHRYNTGTIKRIDAIPKAIVSIIYFDLTNDFPGLEMVLNDAKNLEEAYNYFQGNTKESESRKISIAERNTIITYIISSNLYLNRKSPSNASQSNFDYLLNQIRCGNINDIKGLIRLPNETMFSWTIFEQSKNGGLNAEFDEKKRNQMTYRFKTIPIFFKKKPEQEFIMLNDWILKQAITENPKPFPYNSAFPWPLWIMNRPKKDVSKIQKIKTLGE